MNKSKVALVACGDYDEPKVYEAVKKGLGLVGGIERFAKKGEKIVLKPNLLIGSAPEKCVSTHPAVFGAAARLFQEAGAIVSAGDSPAFGSTALAMRMCGLKTVADGLNVPIADFSKGQEVSNKDGLLVKHFNIAAAVMEADGLVSLPKLKAHGLCRMTGAVKNQFGCVPGVQKTQYHSRLADPWDFGTMLVDLTMAIKPRLYIMDAVIAMEGNGPRSGTPRKTGAVLVSADPVALDAAACKIINLDPEFVPTMPPGEKAGLGTYHFENIEIVGDKIEDFVCRDFDVVRKPKEHATRGRVKAYINNRISPRPVIDEDLCTRCGTCVKHCPVTPKAVDWVGGDKAQHPLRPPKHYYGRCIRCFCCQELCPEGAISIKETLLGKVFFR
jgi:uncharacterized protein (DUF362 family)/Pyruvate/2-oxoacid:ferredoxin oxidoreductase delta subunit